MNRIKKSLTLLEVLIALVFLGLIFTFLMTTFSTTIKTSIKLKQIKSEAFSRFDAHRRLFLLFSHLGVLGQDGHTSYFYTEKDPADDATRLCFSIKNILDPDPNFCFINHCILHVEDKKLLLTYYSDKNPSFVRQEVLLTGINCISYTFYKQKLWIEHSEQIKKIPFSSASWDKDYHCLPHSCDITVKKTDQTSLIFSFPLVSKTYPITYN
jgi:hypothetical protein